MSISAEEAFELCWQKYSEALNKRGAFAAFDNEIMVQSMKAVLKNAYKSGFMTACSLDVLDRAREKESK